MKGPPSQADSTSYKLVAQDLAYAHRAAGGGGGPPRRALEDVSFGVRSGEIFGVIGPSGAGKTTLLRLLNGLASPDGGRILLDGADIAQIEAPALRRRVGMIFQAPALFPGRVSDNVRYPLAIQGLPRDQQDCRGREALARVGLSGSFWERTAGELSQGEQQRVSIARALVSGPEVLLMDEPTGALDPTSSARILSVVRSLNRELGATIVFVTHIMRQAREVCDRALVLIDGRSIEEGDVPDLFDAPGTGLTRRFIDGELEPEEERGHTPGEISPSGGGETT